MLGLAGFCLATILSLLFLLVVRIPLVLRSLVWSCAAAIVFLLATGGYLMFTRAKSLKSSADSRSSTEVQLLNSMGAILVIMTIVWLSMICFLRKRIALAISLIKESAGFYLCSMSLNFEYYYKLYFIYNKTLIVFVSM